MAKLNWTQEQKSQYFEENIRLVHAAVQQFRTMPYEYDDLFQMASMGLLRALDTFDDEKNVRLSTYVTTCMNNEVLYQTRKDRAKSRSGSVVLSYESTMLGNDGKEMSGLDNLDLKLTDMIHGYEMPMEERLEQKELTSAVVKTMKNHLSDVEQKALIMFANDYTQNEIAKELGVSQANVSKLIKLTRHRVILHLRRNGYVF